MKLNAAEILPDLAEITADLEEHAKWMQALCMREPLEVRCYTREVARDLLAQVAEGIAESAALLCPDEA